MKGINCQCDKTSGLSFSSSFLVAPNAIDFRMIFDNWDPSNIGVLLVCVILILLFFPCAYCLRKYDKKDTLEVSVQKSIKLIYNRMLN